MKRSESIELDNDVMINQVLRDIIQRDQIINSLKKKLNIHHNIGDQNLKVSFLQCPFISMFGFYLLIKLFYFLFVRTKMLTLI